jgi:hypothetical protein
MQKKFKKNRKKMPAASRRSIDHHRICATQPAFKLPEWSPGAQGVVRNCQQMSLPPGGKRAKCLALRKLLRIPDAGIAQLVEQLICNQQVIGSNPIAGSPIRQTI